MSTIDTSTWNPDPALNESIGDIPLSESASITQTWQAIQMLMAAGGLHGLQLVTFEGATASADGKQGLVPAPEAGDQDKVLKGDGTWDTAPTAVEASRLRHSSPDSSTIFCYSSGQLPIGSSSGNVFKGSSSNPSLISAPASGTVFSSTAGNVQNIRCSYTSTYFSDIFLSPNNRYIWHRDVVAGSAKSWRRLVEEDVSDFNPPAWNISIASSSDERLKTNIFSVPDAVLDAWEAVDWRQFQYSAAVEEKGEAARHHTGIVAQHVKSVFEDRGLDACEYGILCLTENGFWSVRYAEALAMEAACQRRRADRLEARVAALEEKLSG